MDFLTRGATLHGYVASIIPDSAVCYCTCTYPPLGLGVLKATTNMLIMICCNVHIQYCLVVSLFKYTYIILFTRIKSVILKLSKP